MDANFRRFAQRFVQAYWEEVAHAVASFSSRPVASRHSPSEWLDEIQYELACHPSSGGREQGSVCSLLMMNGSGDEWRFTFRRIRNEWILVTATSGPPNDVGRVNLLDDPHESCFRPLLDRIVRRALTMA